MADLITLAEAVGHLSLDIDTSQSPIEDERLPDITLKIGAASEIVIDYLKIGGGDSPGWTDATAPKLVKAATLLIFESLFDGSDAGEMLKGLAGADLTNPVVALLYRYRDPAMA